MGERAFERNEDEDDKKKLEKAKKSESHHPILDLFGRNLNELAKAGKLDKVVGMENAIDQVIHVINKKKKNNVMLIGKTGVGKTCLAEGIAVKIVNKDIDRCLWNKKVFELNMTLVVSGTKYRGEFENRMKEIVTEVKNNPNIILFIDEIHSVVGAGAASGGMDASNILKPALARGEFICIGATTPSEHKKYIEGDMALDRRFQKVFIEPPSKKDTMSILSNIKDKYEEFHAVTFTDDVLSIIVDMCDRYIPYRNFPDKAIDVMDEVGSYTKIKDSEDPIECKVLEEELKSIVEKKAVYATQQRYEDAAKMRDEQRRVQVDLDKQYALWEEKRSKNRIVVSMDDVATIVSKHSGVPVNKITQSEKEKIKNIEESFNSIVVGQEYAVKKVSQAIKRSKMGIQDPNKPFTMLFLGKTGTGKTYLAKAMAKFLFDIDSAFIRLDMSEYMDKASTSKLIGSPPGYVGYEEKGFLTEKVKNNPYSLILLDEIEKAHPDVFNLFLQVLEDGILTDSHGSTVGFKNCIFIMTSNVGTKDLEEKGVGFDTGADVTMADEEKIMKELKKWFRPEFLNRIDEKILFRSLTEKDVEKIIELELGVLRDRLSEKGLKMSFKPSIVKHILDSGFDQEYGARPLKRLISSIVENEVAQSMLDDKLIAGDSFKVGYDTKKNKPTIDVDDRK